MTRVDFNVFIIEKNYFISFFSQQLNGKQLNCNILTHQHSRAEQNNFQNNILIGFLWGFELWFIEWKI